MTKNYKYIYVSEAQVGRCEALASKARLSRIVLMISRLAILDSERRIPRIRVINQIPQHSREYMFNGLNTLTNINDFALSHTDSGASQLASANEDGPRPSKKRRGTLPNPPSSDGNS